MQGSLFTHVAMVYEHLDEGHMLRQLCLDVAQYYSHPAIFYHQVHLRCMAMLHVLRVKYQDLYERLIRRDEEDEYILLLTFVSDDVQMRELEALALLLGVVCFYSTVDDSVWNPSYTAFRKDKQGIEDSQLKIVTIRYASFIVPPDTFRSWDDFQSDVRRVREAYFQSLLLKEEAHEADPEEEKEDRPTRVSTPPPPSSPHRQARLSRALREEMKEMAPDDVDAAETCDMM